MPCPKCIDVASPGNETYCGIISLVIGCFFPCICCCPVDQRPKGSTSAKVDYEY